ncbi:MAG: CoA-transferase subunit beta [Maricaulaceae bacterium]
MTEYTLAELAICAASEIFRDETPEVFATLIGTLPKLAGYIAKETFLPGMMMSDGLYYLAAEPVPIGPRPDHVTKREGRIGYERVFTIVAKGNRHAFVGPVQVDKYGQMNLSCIGDYAKPKVTMLGVRGLPGNTVNNRTSMFFASHNKRALVEGEVSMVSGAGYNPARYPNGKYPKGLDHRQIITNLCVLDFEGPNNTIRVRSLHPGVTFDEVQDNTGFNLVRPDNIPETAAPTAEQLAIIHKYDPHNLRRYIFKDNPPGRPEFDEGA